MKRWWIIYPASPPSSNNAYATKITWKFSHMMISPLSLAQKQFWSKKDLTKFPPNLSQWTLKSTHPLLLAKVLNNQRNDHSSQPPQPLCALQWRCPNQVSLQPIVHLLWYNLILPLLQYHLSTNLQRDASMLLNNAWNPPWLGWIISKLCAYILKETRIQSPNNFSNLLPTCHWHVLPLPHAPLPLEKLLVSPMVMNYYPKPIMPPC